MGDGGTRHGENDGCGIDPYRPSTYCTVSEADGWCNGLPHRPVDLEHMLRHYAERGRSYNEVIVDSRTLEDNLPHSVEAILDDPWTHAKFIRFYGVREADYPLVEFRPGGGGFREVLNEVLH